jgi:hypothetical protein
VKVVCRAGENPIANTSNPTYQVITDSRSACNYEKPGSNEILSRIFITEILDKLKECAVYSPVKRLF